MPLVENFFWENPSNIQGKGLSLSLRSGVSELRAEQKENIET